MCKSCHKDSKNHTTKLWEFHQKNEKCAWCGLKSWKHSVELWEIHQKTIPKGKKLVVIQQGFGPKTLAVVKKWNTVDGSPYHIEHIPLSMHCSDCNASMSDKESDLADVLTVFASNVSVSKQTRNTHGIADHGGQSMVKIFWWAVSSLIVCLVCILLSWMIIVVIQ